MSEETSEVRKLPLPTRIARHVENWRQRLMSLFGSLTISSLEPAYRCVVGRKLFDDEDSCWTWPELLTAGEAAERFRAEYWKEEGREPDPQEEEDQIVINSEIASRTPIYVG